MFPRALAHNVFISGGTGYIVRAIADAVDAPPDGVRIIEAPELRRV